MMRSLRPSYVQDTNDRVRGSQTCVAADTSKQRAIRDALRGLASRGCKFVDSDFATKMSSDSSCSISSSPILNCSFREFKTRGFKTKFTPKAGVSLKFRLVLMLLLKLLLRPR